MSVPRTARAIAALGLPGLPGTERRVNAKALRDGWAFIDRPGRGGGRLWLLPLHLEALAQAAEAAQRPSFRVRLVKIRPKLRLVGPLAGTEG